MDLLGNPTANSAYQTTLKGVLSDMQPQITQGYNDLSDAFRKAGAQQSGAYGTALSNYASGVERNQAGAAADVLKSVLPSLVSGYSGLATQTPSLLDALKLQQSSSQSNAPISGGGGAPPNLGSWYGGPGGNIRQSTATY